VPPNRFAFVLKFVLALKNLSGRVGSYEILRWLQPPLTSSHSRSV